MSIFTLCHLLLDHIQFTLIHGPNIPGSFAILFFTALDFTTFTTRHIHSWASFLLWLSHFILLELLVIALHSSLVAYWTPSNLGGSTFSVLSFCLSYFSQSSHSKNTGVVCHLLLQWTTVQFRSVQSLSCVQLFATPWITARQASLSITNSWSLLRLMSIESVMPSNHLILCRPLLLLPPVPPSIRVFSNESALCLRRPKY